MAVRFPHRNGTGQDIGHGYPVQRAFRTDRSGQPRPGGNAEQEAEPVLAATTEAGPGDRPRELDLAALEAGLLADLPAHSPGHVLVRLELAAEAVVVTEVNVVRSRVPADHQYPLPILGQQIAQGGENGLHPRHPRPRRYDPPGSGHQSVACSGYGTVCAAYRREDRKSTRLNSSHVRISYAVFCL